MYNADQIPLNGVFMKKIVALLLLVISLLALVSCGDTVYEPIESTPVEAQTVMTISLDNKQYEVRYELYRALFLNITAEIDGGDKTVWSGENKEDYIKRADEIIKTRIVDIYSVFHTASSIGIDVYSAEFNEEVETYVRVNVEGGFYDNREIQGFDGDYQKYLEYLKKLNLNYSVQDLMIRYDLASKKIFEHYVGNFNGEFLEDTVQGALKYTKDDVLAFYNSPDCVRVMRAFLPKINWTREKAENMRNTMAEKANYGDEAVANYIINNSSPSIPPSTIKNGEIIGKHNYDAAYYSELTSVAFSMKYYEVSQVLETTTESEEVYTIIYKIAKTNEHFNECYSTVVSAYLQNEVGKILDTAADSMLKSIQTAPILDTLDRGTVSMN